MPLAQAPAAVMGGILKAINSSASRSRAADYCEGKAVLVEGLNCRAGYWQDEAEVTDAYYHKHGEGRPYYHYVYSLPPGHGTPEKLVEMVKRGIEENPLLHGFEVELAVHNDKAHLHCHILANSTSAVDGHKLRFSRKQYTDWIQTMKVIAREYGFDPVVSKAKKKGDFVTNDKLKREVVVRRGRDSDIVHTYQSVRRAMNASSDWDEFGKLLAEDGVSVEMKPTRKHLVFGFSGRKFRDSNLSRTFTDVISKEEIEHEFELRRREREEHEYEQKYREQLDSVLEDAVREIGFDEDRARRRAEDRERGSRTRSRTHHLS